MEQEVALDLKELYYTLKKRMGLIISITLLVTIISALVNIFVLTPIYEAKVSVVIGKDITLSNETNYDLNDVTMYQKLVKTYAEVAKSRAVAQSTLDVIGTDITVDELLEMLTVTPQEDTQLMDISVKSTDPEEAKIIVEALTNDFIVRAEKLISNSNIEILDIPEVPKKPIAPNKSLNVIITFFLGLVVSMGLVLIREYMDNTVKTKEEVEKTLNLPVIGLIPLHEAE
jgi:capsular polysaccharide biosynthesis protein